MPKPILVSGIQPTGRLHIGNYLGALKNFVDLQNSGEYECYFFIADLHSLTEDFNPKEKTAQIINLAADFLAAGLDPKKSVIFQQSQSPAHTEIAWILGTLTPMGELRRMTQFKNKLAHSLKISMEFDDDMRHKGTDIEEKINMLSADTNVGLFYYPVLMAADILFCDAKFVPVGEDQLQHLELTRTLARKFNAKFGKTFMEPKALITKTPRVMSLDNPEKKMSKSSPGGCLFIDDSPKEIKNKIARAVTDSGREIKYDTKKKLGVSNLLEIYSGLSGETIPKLEKQFAGKSYLEFKSELAKFVGDYFADFRAKKKALLAKPKELAATLNSGSKKAAEVANKKMAEVKNKTGLIV